MEDREIKHTHTNRAKYMWKYIILSFIAFVLGLYLGKHIACNEIEILYVSQAEVLELEKQRVREAVDDQLFFGNPTAATEMIDAIAAQNKKMHKYILLSEGKIYSKHAKSISKQVHKQVIEQLSGRVNAQ